MEPNSINEVNTTSGQYVPIIAAHELKIGQIIGKGQYSTVYTAICRGEEVAVKVLLEHDWDDEGIQSFSREVDIMSRIRHKNVVLLMGCCTENRLSLCIVTELLETNLQNILHSEDIKLSIMQKINFALDTAHGMAWLHNAKPEKIVHRDLKPSNLLLDSNWRVKVADFGLSCLSSTTFFDKKNATGSALWMAPEVLLGKQLTDTLDVYSFGLVMWEIFTRKEPYSEYKTITALREAVCKRQRPKVKGQKLIPFEIGNIIEKCWVHEPSERPSFVQILEDLKNAMIEVELVECPLMQLLWKRHFFGEVQVSSKMFNHFLCQYFNISWEQHQLHFKCLDALLTNEKKKGSDSTPEVNLQRLGLLLSWFGPLVNCPWQPETTILERIVTIIRHSWFFGDIEREEAESILLEKNKQGSFLVRLNLGQSVDAHISPFVISTINKNARKIDHYRVYHTKDRKGFSIQVQTKKHRNGEAKTHLCANGDITNLIALFVRKSSMSKSTTVLGQKYKKLFENSESMYLEADVYSFGSEDTEEDSQEDSQ